jgi:hypothetical protein
MYLTGRKFFAHTAGTRLEDGFEVEAIEVRLGYWRKHPNLHGYIVQEFAEGRDECQNIELGVEELEKIIKAVKDKALPKTEGFFFGESSGDDDELAEDLEILGKAVSWLTHLDPDDRKYWYSVIYHASWLILAMVYCAGYYATCLPSLT